MSRKPKSGLEVAASMNFNVHRRMITQYKAMEASKEFNAMDRLSALVRIAPYFVSKPTGEGSDQQFTATLFWGGDE